MDDNKNKVVSKPNVETPVPPPAPPVIPPVVDHNQKTPTPNKIEVDKDIFDRILTEIADLKQKTSEYEKTASQDQIRKIEALRASGHLVKSVKLRHFNGKLVVGWKMTKDNVWVADGRLHEVQEMDVFYDDGSKESTTLLQFTRGTSYKTYEVLKEAKTSIGEVEYTVDAGGGKELVVLNKFVN